MAATINSRMSIGVAPQWTVDANDFSTLQEAISYADANNRQLIIPPGAHTVSSPLVVDGSCEIVIYKGASIVAADGFDGDIITVGASNVSILGPGTINGNASGVTTSRAIDVEDGSDNVRIEGLNITNCVDGGSGDSVSGIRFSDGCQRPQVVRCHFSSMAKANNVVFMKLDSESVYGVVVEDCTLDQSDADNDVTGELIKVWGAASYPLIAPRISRNRAYLPLTSTGTALCIEAQFGKDGIYTENQTRGGKMGISTTRCNGGLIGVNTVYGPEAVGIELAGSQNMQVGTNTVDGNSRAGSACVLSTATDDPDGNTINGLTAINIASNGYAGGAVHAVNADRLKLDNINHLASGAIYGINLSNCMKFAIGPCVLDGASTGTKAIMLNESWDGTISGVSAMDWTQNGILFFGNEAKTFVDVIINGCRLTDNTVAVGTQLTNGAAVDASCTVDGVAVS